MAILKMGNKTLFTQTGNDEPVINNNVNINQVLATADFPTGHVLQYNLWTNTSGYTHANSEGDGYMWAAFDKY